MAEIDRSVEIRSFLDTWFTVIFIALLVLTAAFGWWAYQVNMVPEVQQEQRLAEDWSESTDFSHSALILQDARAFEAGETVENRPLYYTNLSNELDGTYTYEYTADSGSVDIDTEADLLVRAGEMEGDTVVETFWEVREPLTVENESSLGPNEQHTVEYTVDIQDVLQTIDEVEMRVGATEGLIDVRVVTHSDISGEVEGESFSASHESEKIMVVNPATFRVTTLETVDEQHEDFVVQETILQPDPFEAYGSIVLFALAVMGLIAMTFAKQQGYVELTDEERELLQISKDRDRFSEWISTGTFPSEREYEQTVLVDSLEGLVDVAIDTNKRVIEDEQLGVSTVLDDNYIYLYVRPDSPAREWLVEYADTTLDEFDAEGF